MFAPRAGICVGLSGGAASQVGLQCTVWFS